jgi:hypothetical protein
LSPFFDPFWHENEKCGIGKAPAFIGLNEHSLPLFKNCKKTVFFEGSKKTFFVMAQTPFFSATAQLKQ